MLWSSMAVLVRGEERGKGFTVVACHGDVVAVGGCEGLVG
jgi:hypothetical protein